MERQGRGLLEEPPSPSPGGDLTSPGPVPWGLLVTVSHLLASPYKGRVPTRSQGPETQPALTSAPSLLADTAALGTQTSVLGRDGTDWIREPPGSGSQMNLLGSAFPTPPGPLRGQGFIPTPQAHQAWGPELTLRPVHAVPRPS